MNTLYCLLDYLSNFVFFKICKNDRKRKQRSRACNEHGEKQKHNFGSDICEEDHQDDLDVDGRIILKRIIRNFDGRLWTGLIWLWLMIS